MIRTAILAGLLLVMLSIAYSRMQMTPEAARATAALIEQQPQVRPVEPAAVAAPRPRARTYAAAQQRVPEAQQRVPEAQQRVPEAHREPVEAPAADVAETRHAPAPAGVQLSPPIAQPPAQPPVSAPIAAAPAALPVPAFDPQTIARTREAAPVERAQVAADKVAADKVAADTGGPTSPVGRPTLLVPPPAQDTDRSAPTKPEDMPVIAVAKRPVAAPWDAPEPPPVTEQSLTQAAVPVRAAPAQAVAAPPAAAPALAASAAVNPAPVAVDPGPAKPGADAPKDAPKFMSPAERSRELYKLAREMEDTFISKLAR